MPDGKCSQIGKNSEHCNCSYPGCPKKGNCCQCVSYHRMRGELPACYFPNDVERTYDRSIAKFLEVHGSR